MAQSLLSLCQEAVRSVGGYSAPSTIMSSTDEVAYRLRYAANQTGREIVRKASWQALLTPTTITTVDSTTQYSLPPDFKKFANLTFWNETEDRQLIGPLSPVAWAQLTRGINVNNYTYSFRVAANYLEINPSPAAGQVIGYDYYSRYYCQDDGGTALENWTNDTDTFRLDDDLMILGIRYRFLQREGEPYEEDKADYLAALDAELFNNTPKDTSDLTGLPVMPHDNLPDLSFG